MAIQRLQSSFWGGDTPLNIYFGGAMPPPPAPLVEPPLLTLNAEHAAVSYILQLNYFLLS